MASLIDQVTGHKVFTVCWTRLLQLTQLRDVHMRRLEELRFTQLKAEPAPHTQDNTHL